ERMPSLRHGALGGGQFTAPLQAELAHARGGARLPLRAGTRPRAAAPGPDQPTLPRGDRRLAPPAALRDPGARPPPDPGDRLTTTPFLPLRVRLVRYGAAGLFATGLYVAGVVTSVELLRLAPVAAAALATVVVIV